MEKRLLLIDGNAIFHRAFHALPLLTDQEGNYTNAIYGFLRMLFDSIKMTSPQYIAIAFDHKDKTFRHIEFEDYKANRSAPPPELYPQLPVLVEILKAMKVPVYQMSGFEADDIIGTLATQAEKEEELKTLILTGDKDSFQLISKKVNIIVPLKGIRDTVTYDIAKLEEKMKLFPEQIIDYKALRGDASDNIPGVKGIGDKQAVQLISQYGTLENIYNNLEELAEGQRKKLIDNREIAFISKKMATIIRDMPIDLELSKSDMSKIDLEVTKQNIEKLGFKTLVRNLEQLQKSMQKQKELNSQPSLF